jgi:hypothetical protein
VIDVDVAAFDANDNAAILDNTTDIDLSITGSSTSAVLGDLTGTLTAGVFSTIVSDSVVGSFEVAVESQGDPATNGTSPTITVGPDAAYLVTKISGDASGVPVGGVQPLVVEVRDQYTNPVPNAIVSFDVISSPGGDATVTNGLTSSNPSGQANTDLNTSLIVGDNLVTASILLGVPPNQVDTFTVSTTAGGIAYYTVEPDVTEELAGNAIGFTVTAYDASDNPVDDSSTFVDLSLAQGTDAVFAAPSIQLQNGSFSTTLTDTLVETIQSGDARPAVGERHKPGDYDFPERAGRNDHGCLVRAERYDHGGRGQLGGHHDGLDTGCVWKRGSPR